MWQCLNLELKPCEMLITSADTVHFESKKLNTLAVHFRMFLTLAASSADTVRFQTNGSLEDLLLHQRHTSDLITSEAEEC